MVGLGGGGDTITTATKFAQFDTPSCDEATTFHVTCEFDRLLAETTILKQLLHKHSTTNSKILAVYKSTTYHYVSLHLWN